MKDHLKPRDVKDVHDAVSWALANEKTLDVIGHGSKRDIGRPSQSDFTLDLSSLSGVTLYEPDELVLSAKAGTPIAEIEALVASRNQELAFEPMDYGPLLLGSPGRGTLGGVLAMNLSGPRRIKSGAARDHFLGFHAVSGRGEIFKSGGRVVKNVTGYDLSKLLAGSFGTLAVMTDVTIKVLPRAESVQTLVLHGLDDDAAIRAMAAALGSPFDVSGAAHAPKGISAHLNIGSAALTLLRLEGVPPSIAHRRAGLELLLMPFGKMESLGAEASQLAWRQIRDCIPFASMPDRHVWRLSTAPSEAPGLARIIANATDAQVLFDWGGGLLWVAVAESIDASAPTIRQAIKNAGGHATLIRAPAAIRAAADVFEPQGDVLGALAKRVKDAFDPKGVLNRGRMVAGV